MLFKTLTFLNEQSLTQYSSSYFEGEWGQISCHDLNASTRTETGPGILSWICVDMDVVWKHSHSTNLINLGRTELAKLGPTSNLG